MPNTKNAKKSWQELTERQRMVIFLGGTVDAILRLIALVDVIRRPAAQVRGPKAVWVSLLSITSSFGTLPGAYFLIGRKRK